MPMGSAMGAEAGRLAAAAARDGLGLRLMGGVAIWMVAPSVRVAPFARDYEDLDLAVRKRDGQGGDPVHGEARAISLSASSIRSTELSG